MAILIIGLFIFGYGAAGMLAPGCLLNFVRWFDNRRGQYAAALFRIVFGLCLLYLAPVSRWPGFFLILGLFPLATGVAMPFIGLDRYHKIVGWWCGQSLNRLRLWFLFAMLMGGVLVYGFSGAVIGG
ncbi:MAG: hypothetical protein PHW13_12805 [Methylococcales bacterium]|nr:hypothetical protein [Methylococcales bacterium]